MWKENLADSKKAPVEARQAPLVRTTRHDLRKILRLPMQL